MSLALFLSLLVKSSLIAAAGLIVARFVARRAADRVDILRATVCLLLALPVLVTALPAVELALLPAASVDAASAPMTPLWSGEVGPVAGVAVSASLPWPSLATVAVALWLLGAAAIVGRLLLGLNTLSRWTEQGRVVQCPAWRSPLEPLAPAARPRLVCSARVSSPLSWGVAPGVIVLDPASLAEPKTASAILAHELAHLRRKDWVFLILSRLALALFWFNPWSGACPPSWPRPLKRPPTPRPCAPSTAGTTPVSSSAWRLNPPLIRPHGPRRPWPPTPITSRKGSPAS